VIYASTRHRKDFAIDILAAELGRPFHFKVLLDRHGSYYLSGLARPPRYMESYTEIT